MASPPEEEGATSSTSAVDAEHESNGKKRAALPMGPRESWTLLAQGAEAKVYLTPGLLGERESMKIVKERVAKRYRHPTLDAKLGHTRFNGEVRAMQRAAKAGIPVPRVDYSDKKSQLMVMEYISGRTMKAYLRDTSASHEHRVAAVRLFGRWVAKLHDDAGLAHGDLTTSNAMLTREGTDPALTMIDFGLAHGTRSVEDLAVDLYVLERAFISTHPNSEDLFKELLEAYFAVSNRAERIGTTLEDVRARGRKKLALG